MPATPREKGWTRNRPNSASAAKSTCPATDGCPKLNSPMVHRCHTGCTMIRSFLVTLALAVPASAHANGNPLDAVHRLFYNARYEEAAALALALRATGPHDMANDEARTTALLFVLRGLLKGQDSHNGDNKAEALKKCDKCPEVLAAFTADLHHGQSIGRALLKTNPKDETALFYLGKLDLNYVW